ncbi:MAG: hypothetical protein PF541_02730 [Prolixibacteraceae bacterium]|jgi:hypothetical protein|nr:hypothetical protein [Prolixibacteraceae bacterium]
MKEISVLLLLILFFSCTNNNEENNLKGIDLLSVSNTGCLNTKSAFIRDSNEVFVIQSVGVNGYTIEHQNVNFNCCLPEGIEIEVYYENDTIFYSDQEKVAGNCKCICLYNTTAEIGEVENGDYVLCFMSGGNRVGSVELFFNDEMYEEITVSELN